MDAHNCIKLVMLKYITFFIRKFDKYFLLGNSYIYDEYSMRAMLMRNLYCTRAAFTFNGKVAVGSEHRLSEIRLLKGNTSFLNLDELDF
ncbi:hypothetical protein RIR_g36917.t1 [Rhizophagus irregularis DAOM 181602=DAOM 197198]|nr:hypothetical protein RIR_g36917.t1 [Rhizophagus irregularis DAOM 181602=DAOM 197198]